MEFSDKIIQQATEIIDKCAITDRKLIIAESCTGGLITAALTEIPGCSRVVEGGFLVYSHEMKQNILGVSTEKSIKFGAVSAEIAYELALGALTNSNANIALGVTGIAGPTGGTKDKPVGLVHICVLAKNGDRMAKKYNFTGQDRAGVRKLTVNESLAMILEFIV